MDEHEYQELPEKKTDAFHGRSTCLCACAKFNFDFWVQKKIPNHANKMLLQINECHVLKAHHHKKVRKVAIYHEIPLNLVKLKKPEGGAGSRILQSNLDGSITDGSFTMPISN